MEPVLTQSELNTQIAALGWQVKTVRFSKGSYTAIIESPTKERLETSAPSAAMALAQLYLMAKRRNHTKPKIATGPHINKWQSLAEEYDGLPVFDEKAVPAWKALASECKIIARQIARQVKVKIVSDPDPYPTADELRDDVQQLHQARISSAGSDHPVWSPDEVVAFRTVFEILGRALSDSGYTWVGLNRSFLAVKPIVSELAQQALFVETVARGASQRKNGIVESKVAFMDEALGLRTSSMTCTSAGCERPAEIVLRYSEGDVPTCFQHERENSRVAPGQLLERLPIREAHRKHAYQDILNANRGQTLNGLPGQVNVPGVGPLEFGGHGGIQQIAQQYMNQNGIQGQHPTDYIPVNAERSAEIARAFEQMPHAPEDPEVKASYDALKRETLQQYQAAVNAGYVFEFYPEDDPYPNSPREAVLDLHQNKHMYVYPTESGFGGGEEDQNHPMLEVVPGLQWNGRPVYYNDVFRAIHDFYGHAKEGLGFRADGEDNAWQQHAVMFSPLAQKAMTAETRGQNSYVNFGPYATHNQKANQEDTIYAPQKAGIMPDWTLDPNIHRTARVAANSFGVPQGSALGRLKKYFKKVNFRDPDAGERFGFHAGAFAQASQETFQQFLDDQNLEMVKKHGAEKWHDFRQEALKSHQKWYRHQPLLWTLKG